MKLADQDYQYFETAFCSHPFVNAFRLERFSDEVTAEKLGRKRIAGISWASTGFPHFDPKNKNLIEWCFKPDVPENPKNKYLFPPGRGGIFYYAPFTPPELLADTSKPLIITEGKKQHIALTRLATNDDTNCQDWKFLTMAINGVWGWSLNKQPAPMLNDIEFTGRPVVLVPDSDLQTNEGVAKATNAFAAELTNRGATVRIVKLPKIQGENSDKWGIDDILGFWAEKYGTAEAIKKGLQLIEQAAPFIPTKKENQATKILNLAADMELFHTPDDECFATVEIDGHLENHNIHTKAFRSWLAFQFYQSEEQTPSAQALQDAITMLQGKARYEGQKRPVFVRLASFKEKIYLDLCNENWQIVEIDSEDFRIIEAKDAPVRFKRSKAMEALPIPEKGGDVQKLRPFLNADDANFVLILAWLVNCFRPDYPFPILNITGEQGTAKSTASRTCRALVDPNTAPLRSVPRDERDLMIAASNSWVCAFDNISSISAKLSDDFCRISTGTAISGRKLFTDGEEAIFTAKRPIILNGIGDIASKTDLIDRALIIKLEPIPKNKRKTECKFWAEFEKEKLSIFSGLISAASCALKNIGSTSFEELPRMSDFALWATAAETGLGLESGTFIKFYTENRDDAHSIVLEDSILAEILQEYCTIKVSESIYEQPHVLLKNFLAELKVVADAKGKDRSKHELFPKTSIGLRNQIERINPVLREIGILITLKGKKGKSGKGSREGASLSLDYTGFQASPPSPTSQAPENQAEMRDDTFGGDDTNVTNHSNVTNQTSNVTDSKSNGFNGFEADRDVSDVSDVENPIYSDIEEFVC